MIFIVAQDIADAESPLHGADPAAVVARDGRMALRDQAGAGETHGEQLKRNYLEEVNARGTCNPTGADTGYAQMTFGGTSSKARCRRNVRTGASRQTQHEIGSECLGRSHQAQRRRQRTDSRGNLQGAVRREVIGIRCG